MSWAFVRKQSCLAREKKEERACESAWLNRGVICFKNLTYRHSNMPAHKRHEMGKGEGWLMLSVHEFMVQGECETETWSRCSSETSFGLTTEIFQSCEKLWAWFQWLKMGILQPVLLWLLNENQRHNLVLDQTQISLLVLRGKLVVIDLLTHSTPE